MSMPSQPHPQAPALADFTRAGTAMVVPAAQWQNSARLPQPCPPGSRGSREAAQAQALPSHLLPSCSAGLHLPAPRCSPPRLPCWCDSGERPNWGALHHARPQRHTTDNAYNNPSLTSHAGVLCHLPVLQLYKHSFLASPPGLSAFL